MMYFRTGMGETIGALDTRSASVGRLASLCREFAVCYGTIHVWVRPGGPSDDQGGLVFIGTCKCGKVTWTRHDRRKMKRDELYTTLRTMRETGMI